MVVVVVVVLRAHFGHQLARRVASGGRHLLARTNVGWPILRLQQARLVGAVRLASGCARELVQGGRRTGAWRGAAQVDQVAGRRRLLLQVGLGRVLLLLLLLLLVQVVVMLRVVVVVVIQQVAVCMDVAG